MISILSAKLRLWALTSILPGLLRIPAGLWNGLLHCIRNQDEAQTTNEEKQTAAEDWLRVACPPYAAIPAATARRIIQTAVICVRLQQLFAPAKSGPPY